MPLSQWGAWTPDVSDYEGDKAYLINNVVPRGDGYGPFFSFSGYTSALPAACQGAFYAIKSDGTVLTFAGTSTKLYQLNNTNYTWTDVSKAAGVYSALNSTAQWQFAQFGNLVFATQANAPLQVFDMSSSTAFADCAGTPPQAAYISVVGRFLVLSGLTSNPYRIQWSGLNATTTWTSGVNSSDFQDFPDGGLVRGVAGGDQSGVIFQDQAIRRMSYVPGSPIIFQIDRLTQDKGLFAPYSIIRAGEKIFFYSAQGFQKIEPGGVPEQIGRERIDRYFRADLDISNLQLFIGIADPRSSRLYWCYKSIAGTAGHYDSILGYDWVLDRFFKISTTGQYPLSVSQTGLTLEALDAIYTSGIDAMTISFDSFPSGAQPQFGHFDTTGTLGFFNGTNLEATIKGSEQGTDGKRITIRGFRPITDAATLFGQVSYRDTQAATPVTGSEVAINSRTGRVDFMRDARYQRYQVRIPAGTTWTFCAGYEPDVTTNGKL